MQSTIRKDLILTTASSIVVIILAIASFRLAATFLSPGEVADYVLGRRAVAFAVPVLMLGLGVGLPRFVAAASAGDQEVGDPFDLLLFSAGVVLVGCLAGFLLGALFPTYMSAIVFGRGDGAGTLIGAWTMLTGTCACGVVYGVLRGRSHFWSASILNVLNSGVAPVTGVLLARSLASRALLIAGGVEIAAALVFGLVQWADARGRARGPRDQRSAFRKLTRFSLPRTPGDIAIAAFMALPAFALVQLDSAEAGAVSGLAMSLFGAVTAGLAPVSTVLLTVATELRVRGRIGLVLGRTKLLTLIVLVLSCAAVAVLEVAAGSVVRYLLGPHFQAYTWILRLMVLGIPGWAIVVALRSVLDALYFSARNARIAMLGLIAYLGAATLGALIDWPVRMQPIAFAWGLSVMGVLTVVDALYYSPDTAVEGAD